MSVCACALLQDISLKELPNKCMPPTKAANNLAEMKRLADFVPSWATKARAL